MWFETYDFLKTGFDFNMFLLCISFDQPSSVFRYTLKYLRISIYTGKSKKKVVNYSKL